MTLRHIKIFMSVYRNMSITRASEELHIAQPRVSLVIKELEEHYQTQLFERINRRIFVTEMGEKFYEYALHIMTLYENMERDMIEKDVNTSINVGSSVTIGNYILSRMIQDFHKICPECHIHVKIMNSKQIIQGVIKNEIDIGLVEDKVENDQLIKLPFRKDQLCFVCGKNHPLKNRKNINLEELKNYPFYLREEGSASREITTSLFKAYQQKINIDWESVSYQALVEAVKYNQGITVLPKMILDSDENSDLHIIPCYPEPFSREFIMIYHRNKHINIALKEFIGIVKRYKIIE